MTALYEHPVYSIPFRRGLYLFVSMVLGVAHWGSTNLIGADRVSPVLFALASAASLVAAVRPESMLMWTVSGFSTFSAFAWRLGQILVIEFGWTDQEPPDTSAIASAAYVFCCVATPAVWRHWLHPRTDHA